MEVRLSGSNQYIKNKEVLSTQKRVGLQHKEAPEDSSRNGLPAVAGSMVV